MKHDKWMPSLFKLEYEGDSKIDLCSKTLASYEDRAEVKFIFKVVSKFLVHAPVSVLKSVLKTHKLRQSLNRG